VPFFVQRATVTLRNNEHDDTEHQQQRIRSRTEEISSSATSEDHRCASGIARVEQSVSSDMQTI
jgi:hypothetical protein